MSNWWDAPPTDPCEGLREELSEVRRELIATRIMAYGLLAVTMLGLYWSQPNHRPALFVALALVALVMVFLGCRWGLGDSEMTLGQSLSVTLAMAVAMLLGMWWVGLF